MSDTATAQAAGAEWARRTAEIMARDGVTQAEADRGLIWAINQEAIDKGEPAPIPTDDVGNPLPPVDVPGDPIGDALASIEAGVAQLKVALGR